MAYFPGEQGPPTATSLFIRTSGNPLDAVASVRAALRRVEPHIVLREIETFDAVARESVQVTRLALWLLGAFAVSALALASVGIYGVMSYSNRESRIPNPESPIANPESRIPNRGVANHRHRLCYRFGDGSHT